MKIYFERTGGFMGLRMVASFDTAELPEDQAATLEALLNEVDFFDLPSHLESSTPGMDQFHYVLSVSVRETTTYDYPDEAHILEHDSRAGGDDEDTSAAGETEGGPPGMATHTVSFTDAAAPQEMQPLVRMLTRMAHGQ